MSRDKLSDELKTLDAYDEKLITEFVRQIKHNVCQNMRIARLLSNIGVEEAAQYFGIEPQSLRRIEAEHDRDEVSSRVLLMAMVLYNENADFYFNDWKENELLLNQIQENVE